MSSSRPRLVVSDDQTKSIVTLPGYGYDDVDRAGNIAVWKVSKQYEAGRQRFFNDLEGVPYWARQLSKDYVLWTRAGMFHLYPALYRTTERLYDPIHFTVQITHMGATSFRLYQDASSASSGEKLNALTVVVVAGDPRTRQVAALPEYTTDVLKARTETTPSDEPVVSRSRKERPSTVHTLTQVSVPSDMDEYQHVNQANHIRYCHDAATLVAKRGGFSLLGREPGDDLSRWLVKDLECKYYGEWTAHESVDIHLWEDVFDPLLLHFEMERENQLVYSCFMRFYPRE